MPKLNNPLSGISPATIARIEAARTIDLVRYREDGCEGRIDHFLGLHLNYGADLAAIIELAELLGPDEDFDGLVTSIEDAAEGFGIGGALFG